jgi:hypothetical protein
VEGDLRRAAAYGDSKEAAIRAGERGVELAPVTSDAQSGAYYEHLLARIYILTGEHEKAIDRLERLLRIPYYLRPLAGAGLRGHPRSCGGSRPRSRSSAVSGEVPARSRVLRGLLMGSFAQPSP